MIARSWPSRAASASCACFRSVMSWPTTYSPLTVPSKCRSGTQRARIQRSRPLASMTARSYVIASPANTRSRPGSIMPAMIRAEHFIGGLADHLVAVEAHEVQERLVDELVAAVGRQVDDRLGNVVVEEAQLLLAGGQRLLGQLEVVDVVLGAVEAAHRTRHVEVRRDAAVQPAPRALHRRADALVFDVLAGLRALDDRPQERRDVRAPSPRTASCRRSRPAACTPNSRTPGSRTCT